MTAVFPSRLLTQLATRPSPILRGSSSQAMDALSQASHPGRAAAPSSTSPPAPVPACQPSLSRRFHSWVLTLPQRVRLLQLQHDRQRRQRDGEHDGLADAERLRTGPPRRRRCVDRLARATDDVLHPVRCARFAARAVGRHGRLRRRQYCCRPEYLLYRPGCTHPQGERAVAHFSLRMLSCPFQIWMIEPTVIVQKIVISMSVIFVTARTVLTSCF